MALPTFPTPVLDASQQQFFEGHVLWSSCCDPPVKTTGNVGLLSQSKVLCFLKFLRETDDPGDVCRDFMWWPGPESSGFCPCYRLGYSSTDWVVSHWHHTGRADGPEGYYQGRSISTPLYLLRSHISLFWILLFIQIQKQEMSYFLAKHPCGKHLPHGPVWMGHVREG